MGSTGLLSYPDFLIAELLNSVTAGLTRAVNETGDLNLLLLQDHVSVSTENGARCWQKYVLHLVAFISSPTKPSYREIFQTVWEQVSLPFLAYPEVLTPGLMQSLIGLGTCTPIIPPAPTLRCHVPHRQCKIQFLLKKAPEANNNSTGDQLQDNAVVQSPAACPPLGLLVKAIFTCSLILHEELLANHKEQNRGLRSHC